MNRDDVIRMAREADIIDFRDASDDPHVAQMVDFLMRFAALVAAAERRKHQADIEVWKEQAAQSEKWRALALSKDKRNPAKIVQKIQREAMELERDACAKVCEARYLGDNNREDMEAKACAAAIRARGNQ